MFIDSGTFSFIMAARNENRTPSLEECETYLQQYLAFLRKWKNKIWAAVELDIEEIVGFPKVREWEEKYFRPLEEEGLQIIYCWHPERGLKEWEVMCKRHKYIGIADAAAAMHAANSKVPGGASLSRMIQVSAKNKCKVHGFGITRPDIITKIPFYSCDSMTWKSGERFGEFHVFKNGKLLVLNKHKKEKRKQYKMYMKRIGCTEEQIQAIIDDSDGYLLTEVNMRAWVQMQSHVERKIAGKCWWLGEKEKAEIKVMQKIVSTTPSAPEKAPRIRKSLMNEMRERIQKGTPDEVLAEETKNEISRELRNKVLRTIKKTVREKVRAMKKIRALEVKTTAKRMVDHNKAKIAGNECTALEEQRVGDSSESIIPSLHTGECELVRARILRLSGTRLFERDFLAEEDYLFSQFSASELEDLAEAKVDPWQLIAQREKAVQQLNEKVHGRSGMLGTHGGTHAVLKCDDCYGSGVCPEFKESSICSISHVFRQHKVRDVQDVHTILIALVEAEIERTTKALYFEQLDGGLPSDTTSAQVEALYVKLHDLIDMSKANNSDTISIKASGEGLGTFEKLLRTAMGDTSDKNIIDM